MKKDSWNLFFYDQAMIATYHNHSIYSDGRDAPAQIAERAIELGIDELGLSDHFVIHPTKQPPQWSMLPEALHAYVGELLQLRKYMKDRSGPMIRLGLEVDWFPEPGHAEALHAALDNLPLDYIIGSVHYVGDFTIDGAGATWAALAEEQRNAVHVEYWKRMKTLAESGFFNIVAHIDLPKKFAYFPTIDIESYVDDALNAIAAQNNLVVEINTAGWYKPCGDAYPSEDIVRKCAARNIPMTISADAHSAEHLVRDFDKAAARLRAAGITRVARFAERTMSLEPIDEAVPV